MSADRARYRGETDAPDYMVITAEQYRDIEAKRMLEKTFQERYVVPAFERAGYRFIYHTYRSDRSPAGFPDIVAINLERGLLDVVELKREVGTVTDKQTEWLEAFRSVSLVRVHGVWRPSQIDDLDAMLE